MRGGRSRSTSVFRTQADCVCVWSHLLHLPPWHFLNFLPEPQGQGSFGLIFTDLAVAVFGFAAGRFCVRREHMRGQRDFSGAHEQGPARRLLPPPSPPSRALATPPSRIFICKYLKCWTAPLQAWPQASPPGQLPGPGPGPAAQLWPD